MLYHCPILSAYDFGLVRSGGPGLGNLLFPIMRAVLGAEQMGGIMVRPTVRQIKLGPLLRNETDKRIYSDVLRHRSLREMAVWARARSIQRLPEGSDITSLTDAGDLAIGYVGLGKYFHDLAGMEQVIRRWLDAHARDRGAMQADYDIAVHIRLGDFAAAGHGNENTRIALEWYADAIDLARRTLGRNSPTVTLFTDGSAEELSSLKARFGMRADPGLNALTSIRNIARARILVASRSTFSMWGAYLGGMPALWDATFDRRPFFPARGAADLIL